MALKDKLLDVEANTAPTAHTRTIRDSIAAMEPQFRAALPAHIDAARFTRLCLTALRTTPLLAECSTESVMAGMMTAAQLGVEFGGPRQECFLVPRWSRATGGYDAVFQLGYRGLILIAARSGIVVSAQDVHAGDHFLFSRGLVPVLEHSWDLSTDRGPVVGYWALGRFDGDTRTPEFAVLSVPEAAEHRDTFAVSKGAASGPWQTHFDAMARKTVIRSLLAYLPLTAEVATALAVDDPTPPTPQQAAPAVYVAPEPGPEPDPVTDPAPAARKKRRRPPTQISAPPETDTTGTPPNPEPAEAPETSETSDDAPDLTDDDTMGGWEDPDSPEVMARTGTSPHDTSHGAGEPRI